MEKVVFKASLRDVIGKKVGALRREGKLPAVIYGKHMDPITVTLDLQESAKILSTLSSSQLVTLDIDGKEYPALIREKQRDTIKGRFLHIDFMAVSMTEKITATVRIELSGVAPAVKMYNGMVEFEYDEVEVECLPQDLPGKIVVDISVLNKIGDSIHVKDLSIPAGVEISDDPNQIVVAVISGNIAETAEEVAVSASEPEVIEKGKKEEEA